MHLIESQSTQAAQYIDIPSVYEKYFPIPFSDKYIVFAPHSKDAKTYDYWQDCLNILAPILNKNNIRILQVGGQNERGYNGSIHLMGQTSVNQVCYLVRHSIGVLSTDTFVQHIADYLGIKSTVLISNNFADNVKGYFNKDKQIVLEPPRETGEKPCFALQELPKSINKIKPEEIVKSFCGLLNLEYSFPYTSCYIGELYNHKMIISAVDTVLDPRQFGVEGVICDLSLNFNENILGQQMQVCPVSIFTNKVLSDNILNFGAQTKRIREIVYEITEDNDPEFAKKVIKAGIQLKMVSKLAPEKLNNFKLNYIDIGLIIGLPNFNWKEISELKDRNLENLFFKTGRFILSAGKVYPSKAHLVKDISISGFDDTVKVEDYVEFWEHLNSYYIMEKV